MAGQDFARLCQNAQMKQEIGLDMLRLANEKKLSSLERPRQFELCPEAFSLENKLLTPTFKLKRNVAQEKFKEEIDRMYELVVTAEAMTGRK